MSTKPASFIKMCVASFMVLVVFATTYAPFIEENREPAHAFLGVADTSFEINPIVVTGVGATAVNTTTQTIISNILNGLAWTIAKMTIQSLTRSTVNWINSGFKGSPAFVSDLNENLKYLGDAVADDFFDHLNQTAVDVTGFNIKSPFQDQVRQKLREEYYRTTSSWGLNYTLPQQSKDPKAFLQGDFSKGGFNAYLSASQNPANNPFGAYKLASNQLWTQIDVAAQQRKAELGWGKGFLPWRGNCPAKSQVLSLSKAETCKGNPVRTPGAVIEQQLENSLGSGIRQLELADSINEIVGALVGQLVNQVLGAGGLLGASQPSSGGGRSYLDQATSPEQLEAVTGSLASGVLQNITNDETSTRNFRDSWQKILTAANGAKQSCGDTELISSTVTKATAGVARGNASLEALAGIKVQVTTAAQDTSPNKSSLITAALTSYQSSVASPNTPSPAELTEAAQESSETPENPDDEDEAPISTLSLYSQMIRLQSSCRSS